MIIFLLAFTFGGFVVHQPLVVILGLLDAHVTSDRVDGDKWLIQSLIELSQRLTQGIVLLNNDCRGLSHVRLQPVPQYYFSFLHFIVFPNLL